ncbi:putative low-complexity protein [Rivularia sp. PCC 7116]|uniref:pentapeptide repeat-containing protein n=1 Tax=Rivularia sp. PCC 7116 TaxID=373994 RepID=UPI00029EC59F|nr:pentapeptide repeat-containing protein [Rivularia sp. PCC 7116]AFY58888.1 putative low-complexity protein [Rivularia sp. PCC 7116]
MMNLFSKNQINKRLKIVVEELTKNQIERRIIAIENLEKIALEYPEEYDKVFQIITTYIKQNRSLKILNEFQTNPISEINTDIKTALKIITNPDTDKYLRRDKIDLSCIDIRGANLRNANLKKVNLEQSILYRVNLIDADLENANLNSAVLSAANLTRANLTSANLSGAILNAANLTQANLSNADLRCANLFLANLRGANLKGVNFDRANLREAFFNDKKANH